MYETTEVASVILAVKATKRKPIGFRIMNSTVVL